MTGKPGNGRAFSSQGILLRLEKSEKKIYWKSQGKLSPSHSENPANMVQYFKQKRTLKILENCKNYWKSQGNLSEKVGTMCVDPELLMYRSRVAKVTV